MGGAAVGFYFPSFPIHAQSSIVVVVVMLEVTMVAIVGLSILTSLTHALP